MRTDVMADPHAIVRQGVPPPMVVRAFTDQVFYAQTQTYLRVFAGFRDSVMRDYSNSSKGGAIRHATAIYARYEALQKITTLGCVNPCRDCIECQTPRTHIQLSDCREAPWKWPSTRKKLGILFQTRIKTSYQ